MLKHKDQIHRQIFFCHDQLTPSPSHRVAQHRPSIFRLNTDKDTGDQEHRHFILTDLVESEEVYNRYLRIIIEKFETPLRAMSSSIVQKKELDTIFCNVKELSAVSTQLIADLREAVVPSNARMGGGVNECHSVASLFHASRFKAFVKYIANAEEMQSCLTRKLKESKPFAKFLERVANKTEYMDGLHLSDLLIMPVQRLPRYNLFIRELLDYLPEHLKKSSGLRLAMDQIKTLGRQVEQYVEFECIIRARSARIFMVSLNHSLTYSYHDKSITRISLKHQGYTRTHRTQIHQRRNTSQVTTSFWSELQD